MTHLVAKFISRTSDESWYLSYWAGLANFKNAPNGSILIAKHRNIYGENTPYEGQATMSAILEPDSFGPGCKFIEFYPITINSSHIQRPYDFHESNIFNGFPNTIPDYIPLKFTWHSHACSDSVWFVNLSRNPGFTKFTWFFTPNDSLEIDTYDSVAFAFPRSGPYTVRVKGRTRKGGHQGYGVYQTAQSTI